MLAISVWLAIRDAVSRIADHRHFVKLDAPATPEAILNAVLDVQHRDGGG
jgi:xanthine dehydrogenase large subunit